MMSFFLSGGVEVLGFISPTNPLDQYAVIDPLYGIDGFRNVNTLSELNSIPNQRRRAGMVVGIGGGTQYYKLNPGPWNGTITDWTIFNSGGGGGTFTGGTVTGPTIFTNGLTANTLTVNGVPITGDTYTTGGTYSNGTIDFYYNTNGGFQVTGLYTGQTSYVNSLTTGVGLSGDSTTGNVTIINTDPDQVVSISGGTGILTGGTYPNFTIENTLPDQVVSISGGTNVDVTGTYPNFNITLTGLSDNNIYTTGFTYSANTLYIKDTSGNTFSATINTMTGLTINGDLIVTGTTSLQGFSATTISATTIGTSGDCVDDIYVSNIHSCSPLNINPLDGGNVYFGSTSGVTIDLTNNRVGIGTSTPTVKLQVSGNTRLDGNLTVTGNTSAQSISATTVYITQPNGIVGAQVWNPTEAMVSVNRTLNNWGIFGVDASEVYLYSVGSGDTMSFYTNQLRRMSIIPSGNVGIGITSPTAKLHINNTTSGNTFLAEDDTNLDSTPFVIDLSGNTGIGTLTPISKLHVQNGQTTLVQPQGSDYIVFSSSTLANSGQTMWIRQTATNQYTFGTNLLTSFMKVGPTNVVDFSNQLIRTNGGAILGTIRPNTPYILNLNEIPSGITAGTQDYRGVLVDPTVNFGGTYSGNFIGYLHNPTITSMANGRHIAIQIVSGDVLLNTTSGNVGIGTTTPTAKLQVSGTTRLQTFTGTTGLISAATQNVLTIVGSGNTNSSPIFSVQGSQGELFSVSDSLTGSLFSVNDISGLPVLEVFSDNTTLMGSYLAPSLNTTARVIATTGTTNVYSIPTSAYTGAFFDYTISDGTNLRAGNIMSIWSGTSVNLTETQTTDFGNTSGLTFNMVVSSGNAILRTSGTTGNWTVKTIVRSI